MTIGWNDSWETARLAVDPEGVLRPVRIAAEHRGAYHALGDRDIAWVELTGKQFHDATDKRSLPTVGDWVLVEHWERAVGGGGAAVVRHILPRTSFLVRKAAGEATVPQPIAANVDAGVVLTSANSDLSPARIDRYLSLLRDGGIEPVIVVSKIDLVGDATEMVARVRAIHPHVIASSVKTGVGLPEIRALAGEGKTAMVLGSSGVGKSTLLNALLGSSQETREIRADQRGRHTTTRRELIVADDGSSWIDTPGMRELAQWVDENEGENDQAFDDVAEVAAGCRFRDCTHAKEPGCAVRDAVDPKRLASFHKLVGERHQAADKQAAAQRLAETRKGKKKPPPTD